MILVLAAGQAAAQQAAPDTEVVIVTGTRIERDPNLASPIPVQAVTAEDIQLSGQLNLADIVNDVPALLGSVTGETSLESGFADGTNVLDLRNLGPERTLTLVNGRRHVSGVEGSQSVDIGSIPKGLVERVEVLTGGASAIYGADAVTGVVNFILKDDFEGFDLDISTGLSGEGDASQLGVSALWGANINNGSGNLAIAFDFSSEEGLTAGERSFLANNRQWDDRANPALRFQRGDITASTTPTLARYYNFDNTGLYPYGLTIPTAAAFATAYQAEFGTAPTLNATEQALLNRRIGAPTRLINPYPVFTVSSTGGVIAPADFSLAPGVDVNGNGTDDCLESFVGYNSSFDGAASFGATGGCWTVQPDGSVRPVQDGLITGNFDGFGGELIEQTFNEDTVIPQDSRYALNVLFNQDLNDTMSFFAEAKYVRAEIDVASPYNTFYDLLTVAPDNPFIPTALQGVADAAGGLFITRDMLDLGLSVDQNERRTTRLLAGLKGTIAETYDWEIAFNYGQFERIRTDQNRVILDRFFAGIDVTTDAAGNPTCRSNVDTTPPPATPFDIPAWDPGFYTFQPGDGTCVPVNILGGRGAISQEAIDWVTTTTVNRDEITQTVISANLSGDSSQLFKLPAGPIGFALGGEFRVEESQAQFDPLVLGVIPDGQPNAGALIDTLTFNNSLVYDPSTKTLNTKGDYDVKDIYGEISIPLLADMLLAQELTVDGAYRYSDYSTVGGAETWKLGLVYSPVSDFTIRASQSQAIRAPNIFELFSPPQGAFFRPIDPCDQAEITSLLASDPATGAIREANCRADGLPVGYTDPLSARFPGTSGGNPDLTEETADTITAGFVLQPRFLRGLSLSADYWNIDIADAIVAVSAQDIVDNCYDSPSFPNDFCSLFTRNRNTSSPQYGGFTGLNQTQVNFGALQAEGVDISAAYMFSLGSNDFGIRLQGTRQNNLDLFFDPGDPSAVDPELGELFIPEWSGNLTLSWANGPVKLALKTQYFGEMLLRGAEIESYETIFGDAAIADETFVFDLAGEFKASETVSFYGGVNNISDEVPFVTEQAFPVSPRGRYFFVGARASF
jgi:outer membrane receptor protein involved in Fe transport